MFLSMWSIPFDEDIIIGLSLIFDATISLSSSAEYKLLIGVPFVILLTGNCLDRAPVEDLPFFYYMPY